MGVSSMLADCTYKKTIQASLVLLNVITLAFSLTLIGLAAPRFTRLSTMSSRDRSRD